MEVDDAVSRGGGGGGEPPRIRRLEESVVNRVAAGEVIQCPSSAVKELVENSIDAGSSTISVTVKDGGLKLIQVSDDGHGIRCEDLPILCERHTTSKLSAYEDLQTIKSMGFRGEALASMTYVGHVTVTTITEGQLHGYRVSYRDGVMENDPKPCAAVKGTQIMVENLFYNMVARRKTLQNSNDDYPKIVDFISRFAVHHINVNFSCRKHGANRADACRLHFIEKSYRVCVLCNTASSIHPPEHVDVNIHPTKNEVSLLNQEPIIEKTKDAIAEKLMNCNNTRIFQTQHSTFLYLVNVVNISKELMYQQALCRLGNFSAIQLSEPAPLLELLTMALKDDESMSDVNEETFEIAEVNTEIPKENAEMINEYFSIHIDQKEMILPGNLRKSASERQQLLLETSMHLILPSFQIHLAKASSFKTKIKIAWKVLNRLVLQMKTISIKEHLRKQKQHGLNVSGPSSTSCFHPCSFSLSLRSRWWQMGRLFRLLL
ncbi:hypothetical protein ZWY2020_026479 [Hordeum vulgare]|nr:hypothetical protein ZWY2020_026479 [Hordeum vulgare]